jgi:hypothetical protein
MRQGAIEHLIFDDQGRAWNADSIELRRSLYFRGDEANFAREVVRKLGFIAARRSGGSVSVTFDPRTVSAVAMASLLYSLSDDPPERICLVIMGGEPGKEVYSSLEQVVDRLHRLIEARQEKDQPRFETRALSPQAVSDGSPFRWLLTNWEQANKRLSVHLIKEVDCRFEGRFWVFRPGKGPSDLVIERAGTGLRIPDNEWHAFTPGTRVADFPDPLLYAKWSDAYLSVLRSGRFKIEDTSAKVHWPRAGQVLYEYRRIILPWLDTNGHPLLLGASVAAVRLRRTPLLKAA